MLKLPPIAFAEAALATRFFNSFFTTQKERIEQLNQHLWRLLKTKEQDLAINTMHLARKNELLTQVQEKLSLLKNRVKSEDKKNTTTYSTRIEYRR